MSESFGKFDLRKYSDILMAFAVMGIILIFIIPLPPFVLDICIALNITFAMVIMLMTLFTTEVLQFSVFPTLLLITTLFRLALNISSVRLILGNAYAGEIINSFGSFAVSGNYVVGIIIYIIIMIVQFLVITNGSGRVSEVSARFTLDAMPGKQMSIDADLNSGLIDESQARIRRTKLQQETDFYGSMDGASKFVKGDAIAGILITMINILGGIIIGVMMHQMSLSESASTYVRLTVGDGLVSQIPALLISVASGIIVTRSGTDNNFGTELLSQMTAFPKVIGLAGVFLLFVGMIPGFPFLVFFSLAAIAGICAFLLYKEEKTELMKNIEYKEQETIETEKKEPENVMDLIHVEPMEVEIGYGLIPLADESSGGDLLQRISSVRRQCAIEMGIVVQPIRIRDNLQLKTNEYVLKIRGTVIARSELMPNMLLCMDSGNDDIKILGIKTIEPTFGLPALWINRDQREDAEINGLTVVDPTTVLVTHLTETIKLHSFELIGRQEVKMIIDSIKVKYSAVVEELIPDLMTIGELQKVIQNLLKEKVPIKDMVTIMESLADNSRNSKDIELLTEYVRISLGRTICNPLVNENNCIIVSTLSSELENLIGSNIQKSMQGSFPAIDPESTGKILNSIKEIINTVYFNENQPVILVSPKIRPPFRKLIEMVFPHITVLSLNEIPNDIEIKTEGVVTI